MTQIVLLFKNWKNYPDVQDISRACQNFLCGNRAGIRRMRRAGATLSPELRYASSSRCRSDAIKEPLVRCRGLCNIEDMCGYTVKKECASKRREEGNIRGRSDPRSEGTMSSPVYTRGLEQSTCMTRLGESIRVSDSCAIAVLKNHQKRQQVSGALFAGSDARSGGVHTLPCLPPTY